MTTRIFVKVNKDSVSGALVWLNLTRVQYCSGDFGTGHALSVFGNPYRKFYLATSVKSTLSSVGVTIIDIDVGG